LFVLNDSCVSSFSEEAHEASSKRRNFSKIIEFIFTC